MKINTKEFLKALADCVKATKVIDTNPVLQFIKLEKGLDSSSLSLLGTSTDFTVGRTIQVEGGESVSVLVDAKKIHDIIGTVKDETVQVEIVDGNKIKISSKTGKLSLSTISTEDFPNVESDGEHIATVKKSAVDFWKDGMWAAGSDVSNPIKNSVHLKFMNVGNRIQIDTADGFKCSSVECVVDLVKGDYQAIIPVNNMTRLISLIDGDVFEIHLTDKFIIFSTSDGFVRSAQIEGMFPDWIPMIKKSKLGIVLDSKEMLSALRSAAVVSRESDNRVVLSWNATSVLIRAESETGNVNLEIPYKSLISTEHEAFEIGFNVNSLRDAISMDNEVTMWLTSPMLYASFSRPSDGWLGVVMPMRVK